MMENPETIKDRRLNISLTRASVVEIEQLRDLLEKRLMMRLSLAQVIKRMTKQQLAVELDNNKPWGTSF